MGGGAGRFRLPGVRPARPGGLLSEDDIRARLPAPLPDLPQALEALCYHGLVVGEAGGFYRVAGEMFREWFLRNVPSDTSSPSSSPDHLRLQQLAERAGGGEPETLPGPGGRGVSTGGDVQGSIIITGDRNVVVIPGMPVAPPAERPPTPRSAEHVPRNTQHVSNPFCDRGRINDPTRLFNRERILRELRDMLSRGNSVSLVGEPEIGKSSVLYALYRTRAEWFPEGFVHYVDLQGVLDLEDFCAEVLEGMGREPGDLRALKRALRRQRLVLLLDEAEKLVRPAFTADLHDLLRALAQEPTLTLAVASHRPLVEVFPPSSDTSPFHNIFTEKRLGPFTPAEARAFLAHRLQGTGVTFTPEEMDRLVARSGGHPARLQRLAYALFEEKSG